MTHPLLHFIFRFTAIVAMLWSASFGASALPLTHYAESSKLATGTWRTIKINQEGMQYLSYQQLRNMGFSNPEKVRVYGYGGRKVSESLSTTRYIDDVPMQPFVTTADGIIFFGAGTVSWETRTHTTDHNNRYFPYQNPYSTESIYFLSDCEASESYLPVRDGRKIDSCAMEVDWFYSRLLHEEELVAPSNSGQWLLGEDFRTQRTQTFNFKLKDLKGSRAYVSTQFAAKSSARTMLHIKTNGEPIFNEQSSQDTIDAGSGADVLFQGRLVRGTALNAEENLDVEITYEPAGVVYLANLDYIAISYPRELRIPEEGYVHFYQQFPKDTITQYVVRGCTPTTRIWDVTDPGSPFEITYNLEGDKGIFASPLGNGREFMAFQPEKIKTAPTAGVVISNQNLHSMPTPDMVIITPELYRQQAERVADMHRTRDKMTVYVLTPEVFYNEFSSGAPDISAFRKALKMWYDRGANEGASKLQHCLLIGRPTYDQRLISEKVKNCGYPRTLIWQNKVCNIGLERININGVSTQRYRASFNADQSNTYSSDDYIALLDDDVEGQDVNINSAKMSIGVGRFPVRQLKECRQVVDKLLAFVENPGKGFWRNKAMLIADDGNDNIHLTQSENAYSRFMNTRKGSDLVYDKIYIDAYPQVITSTGTTFPEAKKKMMKSWEDGVMFTQYIGHANPKEWTAEALLTYTDITSFSNKNLPVWYTATCEFARMDADDYSGGEIIWANPDAGAIAMLSTIRTVYIQQNGALTNSISRHMFDSDKDGYGLPLGTIMMRGKNDVATSADNMANKRRFVLLGDPAMRMPVPRLEVKVESINGEELKEDPDDPMLSDGKRMVGASLFRYPILKARSNVKIAGSVTDPDGNVITDFNGRMDYELYDGTEVVTTLGSSQESSPTDYNDYRNRLFIGNTEVKNGKWEATVVIPATILNVTTEPKIAFYAYMTDGTEATGHSTSFYVNGWNADCTDNEGPEIKSLVLNSPSFKDGDAVSSLPVAFGEVTDESGILIAPYGMHQAMTLTIDDKDVHNDIADYMTVKEGDIFTVSFAYPLPELETGKHTMQLDVWDNMGNRSIKSIEFIVEVSPKPIVYDVTTDVNPARSSVTFTINHDRLQEATDMRVDVFNLSGRKVWSSRATNSGNYTEKSSVTWDLTSGGVRVPRGIYLYRATLETADGIKVTRTNKLAVAAE